LKKESSKPRVVLDTKPFIKLFAKEDGWENVQKILVRIENGEIAAFINVVTLTEIYYKYLHEKRADLATARIQELKYAVYLEKIEISEDVAIKAGEFKGKYNIPIADSFIAATAFFENATVISDDADFGKIAEIRTLTEKELVQSENFQ
jgi:predicted nucleic acid-binding protein